MKTMGRVMLAAMMMVVFSGVGQWALAAAPAKDSAEMKEPMEHKAAYDPKKSFEKFSQKLNLTEEQKEKIRPLLNDEVQSMRALHEETMAKQLKLIEASSDKVNALLTPEQQQKYKVMREERLKKCQKDMGRHGMMHEEMLEYGDKPDAMKMPGKE